MNAFAWIRSLTIISIMLLADFTTLKGKANFKIPDRIYSLSLSDNIYNANGSTCKRLDRLNILT